MRLGGQVTFEDYVAVRLPALLRQATVLAGDPDVAEDVVQEVLLRAQPRWTRIARLDRPEAYLRKMIINELVSVRRRVVARLRRERAHQPVLVDHGAGEAADTLARRDALIPLIRSLPPRQRIVIALRYYEDLADTEIAALLGCRPVTVRSYASRALATLQQAITSRQPNEEQE
jgi:RNA polymerase sigma-70 factor (sigma-E family)